LEVVQGESRNRAAAGQLAAVLSSAVGEGVLYLGYPVLATADDRVDIDALLVSRAHGLVALLLSDEVPTGDDAWQEVVAEQDRLYAILEGYLSRYEGLRSGRRLAVVPSTATVFAGTPTSRGGDGGEGFYGTLEELPDWLDGLDGISEEIEHNVHAARFSGSPRSSLGRSEPKSLIPVHGAPRSRRSRRASRISTVGRSRLPSKARTGRSESAAWLDPVRRSSSR